MTRTICKPPALGAPYNLDPADDGIEVLIIRRLNPDAEKNIRTALLDVVIEDARIEEIELDFCRKVGLNV